MSGLTRPEINFVIEKYIGAPGGDLNRFTHRELSQFLEFEAGMPPEKIPPYSFRGGGQSKRERLWEALETSEPRVQLAILEGIVNRVMAEDQSTADTMNALLAKLRRVETVTLPQPASAREEVRTALESAAILVREQGPAQAVDRLHTALQGYMRQKAEEAEIPVTGAETIDALLSSLRSKHPRFGDAAEHPAVVKILRAQAKTLDALNDVRNDASLAHPNPLIGDEEAHLVFSAGTILFNYLERKLE